MSNSSYGKIILFRTEDLEADFAKSFDVAGDEDGEFTKDSTAYFPFGYTSKEIADENPDYFYQLPFNTTQNLQNVNYRILGANYQLRPGSQYGTGDVLTDREPTTYFRLKNGEKLINFLFGFTGQGDSITFKLFKPESGNTSYKDQPYFPEYAGSNTSFINHNLQISRPLTTGKVLTPEEAVTAFNDSSTSEEKFYKDLKQYGNGDTLRVTPVYNYYLKEYEKFNTTNPVATGQGLPTEKAIPNFYYMLSLLSDKETYSNVTPGTPSAENMNSDSFRPEQINLILKSLSLSRLQNPDNDSGPLVSPLGSQLPTEIIQKELDYLNERNSVVVVTSDYYKNFASLIEEQKKVYPFYNEIQIPIQKQGTVFRDILKKAKFYDQLQYRAALQIKLINRFLYLGGFSSQLSKNYNIFYNAYINNKFSYTHPKANKLLETYASNGQFMPYESFSEKYGVRIVEFELNVNTFNNAPDKNLDFKNTDNDFGFIPFKNVSTIGRIDITENNNSSFLRLVNARTTPNSIKSQAQQFLGNATGDPNSEVAVDVPPELDEQIPSPLVFYGNENMSENDYISNAIQNQAKSIFNQLTEFLKLDAISVFENKKNYSEILFFEVQKFDNETNELIQTFLLPNDPEVGAFVNYVDSQIKYGNGYVYKFYAHTISIGNDLKRGDSITGQQNLGGPFGEVEEQEDFANEPDFDSTAIVFPYDNDSNIKLVRVPYQNTEEILRNEYGSQESPTVTYNVDSPPVPPNIEFFPFKNVNNKIGFWFNIGLGEFKAKAILDLNTVEENNQYKKYINEFYGGMYDVLSTFSETTVGLGPEITFKTDDFGGKIQVYRVSSKPTSYSDFKENKIADVDVEGARTFIDNVVPNQDYYYVFRHTDVHGFSSNPSPVYHLKIITDISSPERGSVRVGVDGLGPVLFNEIIYLSDEDKTKPKEKSFKKYLLIERALRQSYLDFNTFETTTGESAHNTAIDIKNKQDALKIGSQNFSAIPVDGKKFKIRITSKQTGRKIDLNVDFKNLTVIENYEE